MDPETQQYFAEINELVGEGGGTVEDPEERAMVMANALDEARGKELQLACNSSCGRVLENLLMNCDTVHAASFLERCTELFVPMALDPGGSHVAEAALKALVFALQGGNAYSQEWYPVVERTLSRICEVGLGFYDHSFEPNRVSCVFRRSYGDLLLFISRSMHTMFLLTLNLALSIAFSQYDPGIVFGQETV